MVFFSQKRKFFYSCVPFSLRRAHILFLWHNNQAVIPHQKGRLLLMHISADNYEIYFDHEHPGCLQIVNTTTQDSIRVTAEEAMMIIKLMLTCKEDLRLIKTGK